MGDPGVSGVLSASAADPAERPLLMVDIDGVISLFAGSGSMLGATPGRLERAPVPGTFHSIEGIPHFLSGTAAAHLLDLAAHFELVWASGWEERANDHLPHLLGLPRDMPFLRFERSAAAPRRELQGADAGSVAGHWKLGAIETYAEGRPLAWIDDALDDECEAWAARRAAPTLLVRTDPRVGLGEPETAVLMQWARGLER